MPKSSAEDSSRGGRHEAKTDHIQEVIITTLLMLLAFFDTLAGLVAASILPADSVFLFGLSVPGLAEVVPEIRTVS